ncbi:unnamed protein product, partial [Heterosigma akashiwo]
MAMTLYIQTHMEARVLAATSAARFRAPAARATTAPGAPTTSATTAPASRPWTTSRRCSRARGACGPAPSAPSRTPRSNCPAAPRGDRRGAHHSDAKPEECFCGGLRQSLTWQPGLHRAIYHIIIGQIQLIKVYNYYYYIIHSIMSHALKGVSCSKQGCFRLTMWGKAYIL